MLLLCADSCFLFSSSLAQQVPTHAIIYSRQFLKWAWYQTQFPSFVVSQVSICSQLQAPCAKNCGIYLATFAKILDEELEIETDVEIFDAMDSKHWNKQDKTKFFVEIPNFFLG
ncbi:uncharacterized protein LOC102622431 [Citrus sinensis]|uniref:uncharacterized protein LOC102622431 n=1 Tax=Citrus sinensis TaxID=2711 RepID=UPI0022795D12|nr:uncharacterized protein LOC102622431 [Citrus sinensis]